MAQRRNAAPGKSIPVRELDSVDEAEVSPTRRCRLHLLVELASRAVWVSARAERSVGLRVQVRHKLEVIHACHCGAYGLNALLLIHTQHPACAAGRPAAGFPRENAAPGCGLPCGFGHTCRS